MAIYVNSAGEEIETGTMATTYVERALNKALQESNQDNIDALQAELDARMNGTNN